MADEDYDEDAVRDSEEDDETSDEEELILFARNAGLQVHSNTQSQQLKLQTKLEKQREHERVKKEAERAQHYKERQAKQRQSKMEKRLLFTLESLRVADSHVDAPDTPKTELGDTGAQEEVPPETSEELKKLYSEAYKLAQERKGKEALPKLELALDTAFKQNNRIVAFSAAALLGEESLKFGRTRKAIECLEAALESAKTLPHVTADQKKYLLARLQSAFMDVGDVERANEVLELYGAELGLAPTPSAPITELNAQAAARLSEALETAVTKKDLAPLRDLVSTLKSTPAALAIARFKHPTTGVTALHVSAGRNDAELVQTLVQMGASVTEKDALGHNPLVWAARYGGVDALEALVKNGAIFDENLSAAELEKWPAAVKERVKSLIHS